jgi:hypothetical protein
VSSISEYKNGISFAIKIPHGQTPVKIWEVNFNLKGKVLSLPSYISVY